MTDIHKAYLFNWHIITAAKYRLDIRKYKKLMRAREFSKEAIEQAVINLEKFIPGGKTPAGLHMVITTDGQIYGCSPFKQHISIDFDSNELNWTGDLNEDKHHTETNKKG